MKFYKENVLVIGDTHLPFEKKGYLEFCKEIQTRCKCGTVVHIGDICDNHAISYYEHHPDGYSPANEMKECEKRLKKWFKAFPNVMICKGNHDMMPSRKGRTAGLPTKVFKPFRDIWDLPKGWVDDFGFTIDDVRYEHGSGSGKMCHLNTALTNRKSTVIGHLHANFGVMYDANEEDCIWGMAVGCGIDRHTYAFNYGADFKRKPILGCGVVTDKGRFAQTFPMKL